MHAVSSICGRVGCAYIGSINLRGSNHIARLMIRIGMLRKLRRLALNKEIQDEQRLHLTNAYQSVLQMTS